MAELDVPGAQLKSQHLERPVIDEQDSNFGDIE
jgi:hypothetical protein